jgi:putative selenium metabolism protein SsnA
LDVFSASQKGEDSMLITHARIATLGQQPRLIDDGAVWIRDDVIEAVDETQTLIDQHPGIETWDAQGQLLMPANLCGHTHFYGAFARGWSYPEPPASHFSQILERLWWRLDQALTAEDVRVSAQVCLVDAIRHGTTTLIDHHASPNAIIGSLDLIADAVKTAGVRAALCYEVTDRDGPARARAGIEENVRFLTRVRQNPDPHLAASFGLHASLTLSPETLERVVEAAEGLGTGFHLHAAEGIEDVEDSLARYGKRVIHRLHHAGILGEQTIVAHAVHVNDEEIDILAETGTWVTHQPRSNMNNAVGFAPVERMLDRGVNVALGNDGFSNNMVAEMKMTYLGHKLAQGDPRAMPADRVFDLAYAANAQLSRVFWPDVRLGEIAPGAAADLILLDYKPTTPLNAANLPWHIIFGYEASAITATVSGGQVLMRDREILTLDEDAITDRAQRLARDLWERAA